MVRLLDIRGPDSDAETLLGFTNPWANTVRPGKIFKTCV